MNDDFHPADELAKVFHGLINGDNFKQSMRDAWDRITSSAAAPDAHQQAVDQMNKVAADKAVQDANKSYLTPNSAATIRSKAAKSIGGN